MPGAAGYNHPPGLAMHGNPPSRLPLTPLPLSAIRDDCLFHVMNDFP